MLILDNILQIYFLSEFQSLQSVTSLYNLQNSF
jgi:hypothetical protein